MPGNRISQFENLYIKISSTRAHTYKITISDINFANYFLSHRTPSIEKAVSLTTEPKYADPKPRAPSQSALSDHVVQAEFTEPESELKASELMTSMGQLYKETQLLLDDTSPAQRSRGEPVPFLLQSIDFGG